MKGEKDMHLLVGTLEGYKLDSKGRLLIPTKWRERLGKEFYTVAVTVRGCKCLTLYPVDHFEAIYESIQFGTENQKYDAVTSLFDNAEEAVLDAQGRFTVSQRLKQEALLENESTVVFKGKGKFIEIWSTDEYEKINSSYDHSQGIYDLMDKLKGSES
jgi:MraZ protein